MNETNIPISKPAGEKVNENLNVPDEVKQALQADINKAAGSVTVTKETDPDFPSEVIDLPSEGYFYDPDSPLSSGRIELKYMTAKEEDILTSQNLIKKGIVLDKLLEALIVTPGVTLDDILIGDKNAIFIAARILAYGPNYDTVVTCPSCGEENKISIPINKLTNKEFDFSKHTRGVNSFEVVLPVCEKRIVYQLLTHRDEKNIDQELKGIGRVTKSEVTSEVTTRLKYVIKSVDGNDDRQFIKTFVDNLLSRDALVLRRSVKENSPDLDMTINFECEACGHQEVIPLPLGVKFFWPDAGV
jgi:transcription elongation factor Elf1